ncbi:hypothetical protein HID58_084397 [Brassica napus]|uniref:Uncharacterized protein n=1 Tax=Brassica napus TaxID=3708 RepID=A0ABQ7XM22_BRANA|nr:hypothetical protein HID58_084397 [Brassica napus]
MSLLVMRQGATLSLPSGLSLRKRLTTVTTRRRTASSSQRAISIPPKDPREAERKLAQLRRDYAKKVSLYRKDYIHEIEMLRVEKQPRPCASQPLSLSTNPTACSNPQPAAVVEGSTGTHHANRKRTRARRNNESRETQSRAERPLGPVMANRHCPEKPRRPSHSKTEGSYTRSNREKSISNQPKNPTTATTKLSTHSPKPHRDGETPEKKRLCSRALTGADPSPRLRAYRR